MVVVSVLCNVLKYVFSVLDLINTSSHTRRMDKRLINVEVMHFIQIEENSLCFLTFGKHFLSKLEKIIGTLLSHDGIITFKSWIW